MPNQKASPGRPGAPGKAASGRLSAKGGPVGHGRWLSVARSDVGSPPQRAFSPAKPTSVTLRVTASPRRSLKRGRGGRPLRSLPRIDWLRRNQAYRRAALRFLLSITTASRARASTMPATGAAAWRMIPVGVVAVFVFTMSTVLSKSKVLPDTLPVIV